MRRPSPSPPPATGPAFVAAAVVVILPAIFPGLFSPLGHSFSSLFSVSPPYPQRRARFEQAQCHIHMDDYLSFFLRFRLLVCVDIPFEVRKGGSF
jgi:hypothetical protein